MTIDPGNRPGMPATARPELRDVAAAFEALLLKEAFAPLSKALGFYGDTVVSAAAEAMTRSAGSGLTEPLEAALSGEMRDGVTR